MPGLFKFRTESVPEQYEKFQSFPAWLPGIPLQMGDIGVLKHNEFTYVSSLQKKGIPFTVRTEPSEGDLEYKSGRGITIAPKISGESAIPKFRLYYGDDGMIVRFGSKKGLLFEATGVKHQVIADMNGLDNAIADAHKKGEWKDEWVVVSDLVIADSATILIPQGKDAVIGLRAKSHVPKLSLANPDACFEVTYAHNMNTTIICQPGLTPLFKVRGIIKKHWISDQIDVGGLKDLGQKLAKPSEPSYTESTRPIVGEIEFKPFH